MWLIGWRVLQAIGGAMLMANSAAILTDAFPAEQRGMALGHQLGGRRSPARSSAWSSAACSPSGDWRSVFWVNVPFGVVGTIWAYRSLRDTGRAGAATGSTGGATSPSPSA